MSSHLALADVRFEAPAALCNAADYCPGLLGLAVAMRSLRALAQAVALHVRWA